LIHVLHVDMGWSAQFQQTEFVAEFN